MYIDMINGIIKNVTKDTCYNATILSSGGIGIRVMSHHPLIEDNEATLEIIPIVNGQNGSVTGYIAYADFREVTLHKRIASKVKGISDKTMFAIMSLGYHALCEAISQGDALAFKPVKGVGASTIKALFEAFPPDSIGDTKVANDMTQQFVSIFKQTTGVSPRKEDMAKFKQLYSENDDFNKSVHDTIRSYVQSSLLLNT